MLAQTRSQMITKIHIGKNQLKMTDNQYRVFLLDAVDKHSCAVMSDAELMQVLQAMRKQGVVFTTKKWKNQKRAAPRTDKKIYLDKITALLTNQGKPQKYADAMAKKAFGIEFVNWLEPWQLKKIIQMLAVYERRHV